jgi:hypothetical protein
MRRRGVVRAGGKGRALLVERICEHWRPQQLSLPPLPTQYAPIEDVGGVEGRGEGWGGRD